MTTVYDFTAKSLSGEDAPLAAWRGQVLLIVNVASLCGFTPQYKGLQSLYETLHPRGFSVLGFPCNQFGSQEPGSEAEIGDFCVVHYGVSFPMFAKIEVNGPGAHPLYQFLKHEKRGLFFSEAIKWNFTKFLCDREGNVAARYAPNATPESLEESIRRLLP